jgi:hypothetical protein
MKKLLCIPFLLAIACTDSNSSNDAGASTDSGTVVDGGSNDGGSTDGGSTDGGTPAPPTLKTTQVDRMGRPAVNTALTDPFDTSASMEDSKKDDYNAASDRSTWVASFKAPFAASLAVYDGLDTMCGNQLVAGNSATAGRYDTLATVLADDVLLLNTASGTCQVYLGVEANATGAVTNTDCGGRTPLEDTIDETYSLLAVGAPSGVTDGVTADADTHASLTAFPFLAAPSP